MNDREFLEIIIEEAKYELGGYLIYTGKQRVIEAAGDIFDIAYIQNNETDYIEDALASRERLNSVLADSLSDGELLRYEKLMRKGNRVADTLLKLTILEYFMPGVSRVWKALGEKGLTVELAGKITFLDDAVMIKEREELLKAADFLAAFFYQLPDAAGDRLRIGLSVDERLLGYLYGGDEQLPESRISIEIRRDMAEPEYVIREELLKKIMSFKSQMNPYENTVIQLMGKKGDGKRFLAQLAEQNRSRAVVCIDYEALKASDIDVAKQIIWYAYRECIFYDAIPVFHGLSDELVNNREEAEGFLMLCINSYPERVSRVYVLTENNVEIGAYTKQPFIKCSVPELTREERLFLWEKLWSEHSLKSELPLEVISAKYKLSVAQIIQGTERLAHLEKSGAVADEQQFSEICNSLMASPGAGSIKKIDARYRFEDLKLPAAQKKILLNICYHVWQRHKVFDTWGMSKVYSYGTGISAIFAGPPGTGKTMAAHVLSNMLGLPLYRVDLSQVVDKYIGESEKKLESIFTMAEQGNMILFFDEADSIFGKRSEVKESNDRYANTEVSYILQRIESYEGIVILATNYKKNIDDAFMRRMRYVVEFTMPDVQTRLEIWKSCITEELPTEDLDLEFLAEKYDLSGGNIKNIMLNAVFLAVADNMPLSMVHILSSIRMERIKMGVMMIPQDFGIYKDAIAEYIGRE